MPHSYKEISPGISWGLTNVIMPNCLFVLKSYFEAFTFCSQVISKNNAFFLFFKNWTIVALQYYVSFCCKPKGISHKRTSLSPGAPSHHCRPSHPSRSAQSAALSACAAQQLPTSYLFYTQWCANVSATLSIHASHSFSPCAHKSVLYNCVSILALQIGSSVPVKGRKLGHF